MLDLILMLLFLAVVVWIVFAIINMMGLPEPVRSIVLVLVGLLCLVALLDRSGLHHFALT